MKFESLIFDIDGTLWDSRALVAEGYNLQLRDEGLERYCVDAARLRPLFGKVMSAIADALFPDMPPQVRYPLMERCMARKKTNAASAMRALRKPSAHSPKPTGCSSSATVSRATRSCASKSWDLGSGLGGTCASVTPEPARGRPSAP